MPFHSSLSQGNDLLRQFFMTLVPGFAAPKESELRARIGKVNRLPGMSIQEGLSFNTNKTNPFIPDFNGSGFAPFMFAGVLSRTGWGDRPPPVIRKPTPTTIRGLPAIRAGRARTGAGTPMDLPTDRRGDRRRARLGAPVLPPARSQTHRALRGRAPLRSWRKWTAATWIRASLHSWWWTL